MNAHECFTCALPCSGYECNCIAIKSPADLTPLELEPVTADEQWGDSDDDDEGDPVLPCLDYEPAGVDYYCSVFCQGTKNDFDH